MFSQCRACHTVEQGGRSGVGPNLHGVVGRKAASIEGFRCSAPMREKAQGGFARTEDQLRPYLRDAQAVVPGGSMNYPGLRNEQQLNDSVAYLKRAASAAQ